jgi:tetratricopeptide (TPR) repeat protein
MFREALMEYEKYFAVNHGSTRALGYLGHARGRLGDRSQALWVLEELRALSKQRFVSAYYFALVYAGMGEKDQAFAWLEKACEERAGQVVFLKVDVEWDPLRSDPRFAGLVRRVGLQP